MRVFLGATLVATVCAGDAFEPGKVHVLTESNFPGYLQDHQDGALVEFYAPWCGHCKQLEPEYNKAAEMLHADGVKIPLGKVDATVESKLAGDYEVRGYPTLKYFVGGEPTEYDGGRNAPNIVDWVKSMSGPAVQETQPLDTDTLSVTLYSGELLAEFESAAKSNRKAAQWYWVKDSSATKVVLKHKGESAITQESADGIDVFFKDNKFPLFGSLNGDTFSTYVQRGNGLVWGLFSMTKDTVSDVVEEHRPVFTALAQKFGSDFSFTWTNTVEFAQVLDSMFGVTEFPRVVVQTKAGDKKKFIYDGELTTEAIGKYIEDVQSGAIKPKLKSEEAPEEPQEDAVKVVTGNTLEQMVFTEDKDVLLEIYAPWCGHCKKLEPEYEKVAKKVIKEGLEDILVLAKMDGTLNDSPVDSIEWQGFPTIYYVEAGNKTPSKYEGDREAKGMWQWLKKNHSKQDEITSRMGEPKPEHDEL